MARKPDYALLSVAAISFFLSGCGRPIPSEQHEKGAVSASANAAGALETLAADSGVISEAESQDIIGSYGQTYDGGEDRLCVVSGPDTENSYRTGVEIRIGDEEYCHGAGSIKRSGKLLIFRLAAGRCTITARDEGDRIVMPGAVDQACASLCSARGSLAGVTFPRIASGAKAGQNVQAQDGKPLCAG